MKHIFLFITCFSLISCESFKSFFKKEEAIETDEQKMSYMLGYILSENIKKSETYLDKAAFLKGIQDNVTGSKSILSPEEMKNVSNKIAKKAQTKRTTQEGEKHMKTGKEFLEKNKENKGIIVTKSGLQYEVLKKGEGGSPKITDIVEVHYKGTLIDGTEFDSSYARNSTASFPVGGVIKGWQEGLQLMNKGSKYKFYIPSDLGYGGQGAGGKIPPHAVLIFEVELLNIKSAGQ